jgi:hypothetical protein
MSNGAGQGTGQGIVRDQRGEEQPTDKGRAQTAHKSESENAVSREATRHPKEQQRQSE